MSEIADFLEIFVPEEVKIKVPESVQSKLVTLQVEKKTMKEIISDLGLELSGKQITMTQLSQEYISLSKLYWCRRKVDAMSYV